jgi:hypothetical protein
VPTIKWKRLNFSRILLYGLSLSVCFGLPQIEDVSYKTHFGGDLKFETVNMAMSPIELPSQAVQARPSSNCKLQIHLLVREGVHINKPANV